MVQDSLISIGELARRASLPVKTVRYYSDIGVLPPAQRTSSGYRLYGEQERLRLETVKTLRSLGFGLRDIAGALQQRKDLRTTIELQIHAITGRIRELRRVAVVLQAALDRSDEPTSAHLGRLETLAHLSDAERTALLDDFLTDIVGDVPVDPEWLAGFRQASLPELPDEPSADQLDAWLQLAELLADPDFRDHTREVTEAGWSNTDPPEMSQVVDHAVARAEEAVTRGIAPDDPAATPVVQAFVAAHAPVVGSGSAAAQAVLDRISRFGDERFVRYWQLLGRIKEWDHPWDQATTADAYEWLIVALRHRLAVCNEA